MEKRAIPARRGIEQAAREREGEFSLSEPDPDRISCAQCENSEKLVSKSRFLRWERIPACENPVNAFCVHARARRDTP
jgi:hypothetical protein